MKGTLRKIRENFSSFEEIWLFAEIFTLLTSLPFLLKFLSLPRLMRVLTPRDVKGSKDLGLEKSKDKIVKYTDYILSFNFWIYKNTCLKRALVLYHFLRKSRINVHICFGVRYNERPPDREAQKHLEGHSWILYKGDIFLDNNAEETKNFKMTYYFPKKAE